MKWRGEQKRTRSTFRFVIRRVNKVDATVFNIKRLRYGKNNQKNPPGLSNLKIQVHKKVL